jgi:hypothetical protein
MLNDILSHLWPYLKDANGYMCKNSYNTISIVNILFYLFDCPKESILKFCLSTYVFPKKLSKFIFENNG